MDEDTELIRRLLYYYYHYYHYYHYYLVLLHHIPHYSQLARRSKIADNVQPIKARNSTETQRVGRLQPPAALRSQALIYLA